MLCRPSITRQVISYNNRSGCVPIMPAASVLVQSITDMPVTLSVIFSRGDLQAESSPHPQVHRQSAFKELPFGTAC